jgi:hypothetical protein
MSQSTAPVSAWAYILAHGAFEEIADDGVSLGGVGPGHDQDVQVLHLGDRVAHNTRSNRQLQPGHAAGVAQTGAVVNIVGDQHRPDHLLQQIIFFIGGFSAGKCSDAVAPVAKHNLGQLTANQLKGFVPCGFAPHRFS